MLLGGVFDYIAVFQTTKKDPRRPRSSSSLFSRQSTASLPRTLRSRSSRRPTVAGFGAEAELAGEVNIKRTLAFRSPAQ